MVQTFVGLPAFVACGGVHRGLRHYARAVRGVGQGCFEAKCGKLVTIYCPQIEVHPSQGLVDTTRAGLRGGGEGVG